MAILLIGLSILCILAAALALLTVVVLIRQSRPKPGAGELPGIPSPADGPRLVAITGSLLKQEFVIPSPPYGLTIGRSSTNDVVLADDMLVSRRHAQLMPEGDQYTLYDRDSINGVFVNDRRIVRHCLVHGDRVQICNTCFRFIHPAAASRAQPVPSSLPAPAPSPLNSMELSAQSLFQGYLLEKELGRGGMSVVYKARDAQGMAVAIKVLDVTDDYVVKKFEQEGQIGTALRDHPNIRVVYQLGRSQDRRLYLVMEYVEGRSLRDWIGASLSESQIVRVIGQVCAALHYTHQRGVVHRDIKPENILINEQGVVKVTDFGIAKLASSVTVTKGRIVGTPEYISPEQARGERVLPTGDIYSLGIVLYELLTGQPPFTLPRDAEPNQACIAVLSAHIRTPPAPPHQMRPGVSEQLERVTLRALEKDPARRFTTAWEMGQALGFRPQVPSLSIPATPPAGGQVVACLTVVRGRQAGRRIGLSSETTVLGREQIAPDDRYISSKHLSIAWRVDQLWLEDMSRNGTWVNGERIYGEVPVQIGDEIALGNHVLRIEA